MACTASENSVSRSNSNLLTVDRIFHDKEFELEDPVPSKWLREGNSYTTVEKSTSSAEGFDIIEHDSATGEQSILVSADRLIPEGSTRPLEIKDYAWSKDRDLLLIFTNTKKFRRYESLGDYWLLNLKDWRLRQIGKTAEPSTLMYATFSPDSRSVAYVRENNIYVESTEGTDAKQLTNDGSDLIFNGIGDWVNEEEFFLRAGFRWSPDSKRISYWQFDTAGIGTFYMIKDTENIYSQVIPLQYPKPGTTTSATRIGTVDIDTAKTVWVKLSGDPRQNYVAQMSWADNSEQLIMQHVNRLQNRNEVVLANVAIGSVTTIFTDEDDAWIEVNMDLDWLDGGKFFTWLSERDGWRHLYLVSRDGKEVRLLSPGAFDIISIEHIDLDEGAAYYIASPNDNTARYLFRSPLFGTPKVERLTPTNEEGLHSYEIAPNSKWAFHTVSSFGKPPVTDVVSLPSHKRSRIIVENGEVVQRLQATARGEHEFFRLDIGEGVELDGWMMKPPSFDATKKYPLLMYVYSEPAGQTVLNRWGGDRYLWHMMMTQRGYIIASVDSRGTPAPRGRAWRKSIYRQIGILASADQANAVRTLLRERPYLDGERVGSWGWSGGGQMTLNAMFRYPDLYHVGIAIAFVSNQRLYNSIYQERFMGLPSGNEEGYRLGSPITFAERLKGELLLIHGTGDDNVHYQNSVQLVDELIAHNKKFTFMMYPDRSHSISEKPNTERHLFDLMTNFLLDNLPAHAVR
jgi:dipeptidyl-peptidase-4